MLRKPLIKPNAAAKILIRNFGKKSTVEKPPIETIPVEIDSPIEELSIDMLMQVFSFLELEDLKSISLVNKKFHKVNDILFWKTKFRIHFPHLYTNFSNPNVLSINWFAEFKKAYYAEHTLDGKLLPLRIRQIFSFVKEGNLESLKKMSLRLSDLLTEYGIIHDSRNYTIFHWAKLNGHQKILDYFYSLAHREAEYTSELFKYAIMTHQPVEKLKYFIAKGINVDAYFSYFGTALDTAYSYANADAVKFLVENGASPNNRWGRKSIIFNAVEEGNTALVQFLLEKEADPNSTRGWYPSGKSESHDSLLHVAARLGHYDILQVLLNAKKIKVDPASPYKTPLMCAIERNHIAVAQLLIGKVNINATSERLGVTALLFAVAQGNKEMVDLLLDAKADVSAALTAPHYHTHFTLMRGDTALHFAAKLGRLDIMKKLLEKDANILQKSETRTLLMSAAMGGHLNIVNLLLKEKKININAEDEFGATALFFAVEYGHKDIVDILIKEGATTSAQLHYVEDRLLDPKQEISYFLKDKNYNDPRILYALKRGPQSLQEYSPMILKALNRRLGRLEGVADNLVKEVRQKIGPHLIKRHSTKSGVNIGDTALSAAVKLGHIDIVKTLLDNGENIDQEINGRTPLMIAVEKNNKQMVEFLMRRGAVVNLPANGETALSLAIKCGRKEIIKLLNPKIVTFLKTMEETIIPLEKVKEPKDIVLMANGQLLKILENIVIELQNNNRTRNVGDFLFQLHIKNSALAEQRTDLVKLLVEKLKAQKKLLVATIPPEKFSSNQYQKHKTTLYQTEKQVLHLLKQAQIVNQLATKEFGRRMDGEGTLSELLTKSQQDIVAYKAEFIRNARA